MDQTEIPILENVQIDLSQTFQGWTRADVHPGVGGEGLVTGQLGQVEVQNGRRLLLIDFQHYCQMSSWIQTIDLQSVHWPVLDSETEERDQTWCDFFVREFRMLFSGIIERFYNKQIVKLMFAIINIYSQIRIPILRPSYSRSLTSLICKKNFLFIVRLWKKKTFENNIISLKTIFMNELYFRYFFRAITNCSGPHSGLCLVGC